ncbi:MAG: DoxX family protein [Pseudomonadota bacterium]
MTTLITKLRTIHQTVFTRVETATGNNIEGLLARFVFLSVLFFYFWRSAFVKLDGFFPNAGAYAQILPQTAEALHYDVTQFDFHHHLIVYTGTYGEVILPLLVVIGLFARVASIGMIVFIAVQSIVDVWGHFVDGGKPFDPLASGVIADQRILWVFLLTIIVLRGPGWLSMDRLLDRFWRDDKQDTAQASPEPQRG